MAETIAIILGKLKDAGVSEELMALITPAVAAEVETGKQGLITKNSDLVTKNGELSGTLTQFVNPEGGKVTPDDLGALFTSLKDLRAQADGKGATADELKLRFEAPLKTQISELETAQVKMTRALEGSLIEQELQALLLKGGVAPGLVSGLVAQLRQDRNYKLKEGKEKWTAVEDTDLATLSIADSAKQFLGSEAAKDWVNAADNAGGASDGGEKGAGGGDDKGITSFRTGNLTEQGEIFKADPAKHATLQKQYVDEKAVADLKAVTDAAAARTAVVGQRG